MLSIAREIGENNLMFSKMETKCSIVQNNWIHNEYYNIIKDVKATFDVTTYKRKKKKQVI